MTAAQESFYIQQFKRGDNSAFQILYQHHYKRIIQYGRSNFPYNEDDIKDAYQDIFLSIWKGRERLKDDLILDHYLKKSLKNNLVKVKKKELKFDKIPVNNELIGKEFQSEENYVSTIVEAEIQSNKDRIYNKRLDLLTKRQRFLFTERFINEKSPEEIMKEHNLARQTVYNTIHTCLTILKTGYKPKRF
jgi:RNA polymerase sigma-70 factor (ECF subfamily)